MNTREELFMLLAQEHGIAPLEIELDDIIAACRPYYAAEIALLKKDLFAIQKQYEQASKDTVEAMREIARLEAEKAELIEHLDAFRIGFLLVGARNSAAGIEKILEKHGRK